MYKRQSRNRRRVAGASTAAGAGGAGAGLVSRTSLPSAPAFFWTVGAGRSSVVSGSASGSGFGGGLSSSGISTPPTKPGTLSPTPNALLSTRHQSGWVALSPSSSMLAMCGGEGTSDGAGSGDARSGRGRGTTRRSPFARPPPLSSGSRSRSRCTGTWAGGACGAPAVPPAASTTSSGLPRWAMMRRTAAGLSTVALALRRSISLRSSDTSRIRTADDNCRCWATSPTRLRYS